MTARQRNFCRDDGERGQLYREAWTRAVAAAAIKSVTSATPVPVNLPCLHEGPILERAGCDCDLKHVRDCDLYDRCTRGRNNGSVASCATCPDYRDIRPAQTTRIDSARLSPGPAHFNCSLIDYQGGRLLAYRKGPNPARIYVVELGDDLQPVGASTRLWIRDRRCIHGTEDPRLFTWGGRLHVAFVGVKLVDDIVQTSMMVARLSDAFEVERLIVPDYRKRTPQEKNWQPFERGGTLHWVYNAMPHTILRMDPTGRAHVACETTPRLQWSGGIIRGGAPPVLVGDEYYHWFHGFKRGKPITYSVGVYTFAAAPPHAIRRITRHPILVAPGRTAEGDKTVVFPCGAIHDRARNRWLVSYGLHDQHCEIAEWNADELERVLEPV